jgi:hypothetical protein
VVPKLHVIGARDLLPGRTAAASRWCYTHGKVHKGAPLRLVTTTKDASGKWVCEAKAWFQWPTALLASAAVQADLAKLPDTVRTCRIQTCKRAPAQAIASRPEDQEAAVPVPVAAAGDSSAGEPTTRSVANDRGRAQAALAAQSTSKSALKTATGAVRQGAKKLGMSESHPATLHWVSSHALHACALHVMPWTMRSCLLVRDRVTRTLLAC